MARRKDHTREELKDMAIQSGRKIIDKQGIKNLTMRKISGDIGYTVGTLYNLFDDFEDLMLHINAQTLDDLFAEFEDKLSSLKNKSSSAFLKKIAQLYIGFAERNFHLWSVLTDYEHDTDKRPEWYQQKTERLFSMIEDGIRTDCANAKQSARSAKILWASVHGICVLGLNGRLDMVQAESVETLTNTLIDNYTTGLKG